LFAVNVAPGPHLVGDIVHDDELTPATLDEYAVFERHNAVGLAHTLAGRASNAA
jgi:hypothetical protein